MPPALVPGLPSQLWGFGLLGSGFSLETGSAQWDQLRNAPLQSPGASQEGRGESWDGGQNILKSAWQGWDIFIYISIFGVGPFPPLRGGFGGDIPHG